MPATIGTDQATEADQAMEKEVMSKLIWRIIPLLGIGYFLSFVDRVNVGFAALQMNQALGLTAAQFGIGAGIFFLSYVAFEIPSNVLQARIGARIWIARIMISWGIISGLMVFVVGPISFYAVRLALGAGEAGFFPGVVLYLTYFFPARQRARIIAIFTIAVPISSLVGSPISAWLLQMHGLAGLAGWQWLFIMEALPAVIVGILLLIFLPDRPETTPWLRPDQKQWLIAKLATTEKQARVGHVSAWRIMINPYVWVLAFALGGGAGVSSALSLWQPQIIKSFGLTDMQVGLVNAIPFGVASVAMVLWGLRSDRRGERVWHTILPLGLAAVGLVASMFVHQIVPFIVVLCVILVGTYAFKGPFWGLSTEWLAGPAAVIGLAQVNSMGNVGTFIVSTAIGLIRDATGSFGLALLPLVVVTVLGCAGLLIVARRDGGKRRMLAAQIPLRS